MNLKYLAFISVTSVILSHLTTSLIVSQLGKKDLKCECKAEQLGSLSKRKDVSNGFSTGVCPGSSAIQYFHY